MVLADKLEARESAHTWAAVQKKRSNDIAKKTVDWL